MRNLWKAPLPKLKPVRLKSVRLKPLPLKSLQSSWAMVDKGRRIKVFGGLAFASLLLVQVSAPWGGRSSAEPGDLEPALWQTTGMVRQSIVDLYRARRLLVQVTAPPAESANATTQAPKTAPAAAAAPSSAATAPAPAANSGSTRSLPQPSAPPAPSVSEASFDPGKTIDTNLEMRVAIAKNASSLEVSTSVDGYMMDINGQNHCNLPAQSSLMLKPQGSGMAVGNCTLSNTAWLEPGEGGYVFIGDSWYKGRVLMITDGSGLMAVNFVLMHDYLSSVVGSEMYVGWPAEALKAQAVAARSYALVHHVRHAQRAYDLDNTQRYQAYKGIAKETNTTQAAVAATTGEFISYNGGIVESLYAASDAIVQAAHGGNGMSQTGAMELASKGYNYTQILGNYYPGTSLSRLVVE
ncbi:SpoIID/LytB domain-containing protein [Leptolyngbya sp. CCNP1308]|uniref:SpoIID/LytB domain-containing protein n=1 Tax=Leptolyngbya sp. CCNP1308 TaxID=3110255 RepID=UPI002B207E96|nr:SpoIID/LytB domain-containing protein [Leptolyngbya sp. CCNP1308]MEA5450124.1 SpoIID/LytB domain-containing protein [Leptolyngbya sp. CCNP1308]